MLHRQKTIVWSTSRPHRVRQRITHSFYILHLHQCTFWVGTYP